MVPDAVTERPQPGEDFWLLFGELADDEKRGLDAHARQVLGNGQRGRPRSVVIGQNERAVRKLSARDR